MPPVQIPQTRRHISRQKGPPSKWNTHINFKTPYRDNPKTSRKEKTSREQSTEILTATLLGDSTARCLKFCRIITSNWEFYMSPHYHISARTEWKHFQMRHVSRDTSLSLFLRKKETFHKNGVNWELDLESETGARGMGGGGWEELLVTTERLRWSLQVTAEAGQLPGRHQFREDSELTVTWQVWKEFYCCHRHLGLISDRYV